MMPRGWNFRQRQARRCRYCTPARSKLRARPKKVAGDDDAGVMICARATDATRIAVNLQGKLSSAHSCTRPPIQGASAEAVERFPKRRISRSLGEKECHIC
jgi:hypothetical protein